MNQLLRFPPLIFASLLASVCVLTGCGGKRQGDGSKHTAKPVEEEPEERRKFVSGGTTLHQMDENRRKLWDVTAKDATLVLENGEARGELIDLSGTVYNAEKDELGKVKAKFTAGRGRANQTANTLQLRENVVVSTLGDRKLTAGVVEYLPGYELLHAGENVGAQTPNYKISGVPTVVASSDLKTIGTPDAFRDKIQMLMRKLKAEPAANQMKLAMLAAILVPATSSAQSTFQTESITIRGWKSIKTSELPDGRVKFSLSGGQIVAESAKKGFVARGSRVEGFLKETAGKRVIETASFSGGVQVELNSDSNFSKLTTDRAELINGETPVLKLPSAVSLVRSNKGSDQTTTLRAASAVARLAPLDSGAKQTVRRIELSGGVVVGVTGGANGTLQATTGAVTMVPGEDQDALDFDGQTVITQDSSERSIRLSGSGGSAVIGRGSYPLKSANLQGPVKAVLKRTNKGFAEQYTGNGRTLTYNDAARWIKLTGQVVLVAKARLFDGENRGDELILSLNDKREVNEVEMTGEPGSTAYNPKEDKKP